VVTAAGPCEDTLNTLLTPDDLVIAPGFTRTLGAGPAA